MSETRKRRTPQVGRNVSPRQIEMAMAEAGKLRVQLEDEDNKLIQDTLEGETAVFDVMDSIAVAYLQDKFLVERAQQRIKRLKHRMEVRSDVLARMMDALSIGEALERDVYTLGLEWDSKVIITDQSALDQKYIKEAPDRDAIGKDLRRGEFVGEGAELSNPQPHARINSR